MQTKGPWDFNIFEEYPEERGGYFVYSPGVKSCIAKLITTGDFSDYEPEKTEAYDNARLISASPDLLYACQKALAYIENGITQLPGINKEEVDSVQRSLREAVAKATGITSMRSIKKT